MIKYHEIILWIGDLNCWMDSLDCVKVKKCLAKDLMEVLQLKNQLNHQRQKRRIFEGFREQEIGSIPHRQLRYWSSLSSTGKFIMLGGTLEIKLDALMGFGEDQLHDILMIYNWWQARKFLFCAGCYLMMSHFESFCITCRTISSENIKSEKFRCSPPMLNHFHSTLINLQPLFAYNFQLPNT